MSNELTVQDRRSVAMEHEPTAMQLLAELAKTSDPQVAVAVAQQIANLQIQMEEQTWKREERQSRIDFDVALADVQSKIGRIAPDKPNAGVRGNAWYLTYSKLDRIVRPLYTEAGFSISFGEEDCPTPGKIRVAAHVSRQGITRKFIKDVTPPLLGPKGEPVMTPTHGDTSANSYARRYLMYDIFNIAVGIDKDDNDGNPTLSGDEKEFFEKHVKVIEAAKTIDELRIKYPAINKEAEDLGFSGARTALATAKNDRYRALVKEGK
jgi:hypothetical protein